MTEKKFNYVIGYFEESGKLHYEVYGGDILWGTEEDAWESAWKAREENEDERYKPIFIDSPNIKTHSYKCHVCNRPAEFVRVSRDYVTLFCCKKHAQAENDFMCHGKNHKWLRVSVFCENGFPF